MIAPIYDQLVRLVFGNSIEIATTRFLSEIKESDKVLILGGGSGKLLERIPKCREITFLDKSQKMVGYAGKRNSQSEVIFVQRDFFEYSTTLEWDVVICPFFLDCFDSVRLELAVGTIANLIKKDGNLLVTEFQGVKSAMLFRVMHLFFRLFASLESKKLKNVHQHILEKGFYVEKEEFYHKNIIFSRVYGNL